jgi:hypothetical protein
MASSNRNRALPPLPFGFVAPSERDLGRLGRDILRKAAEGMRERHRRARILILPALLFYVVYAFGVAGVLWALRLELSTAALVALHTAVFLFMALLGQHFRGEATWDSLQGGMGHLHRVLLVQAFVVRAVTAAFFVLPCQVLGALGHLFPRAARVDARVLSVAAQLAAALDEPVALEALAAAARLPRPVLEEATLLLEWAGIAQVVRRSGQRLLLPTRRRDTMLLSLGKEASAVVKVSDLK